MMISDKESLHVFLGVPVLRTASLDVPRCSTVSNALLPLLSFLQQQLRWLLNGLETNASARTIRERPVSSSARRAYYPAAPRRSGVIASLWLSCPSRPTVVVLSSAPASRLKRWAHHRSR